MSILFSKEQEIVFFTFLLFGYIESEGKLKLRLIKEIIVNRFHFVCSEVLQGNAYIISVVGPGYIGKY